ncbi:hypothetical protein X474_09920 [Dethiosulfatarculus sandiegensis]|uniref:Uncharacterized protein n=1 Tax=Dethiosulfatarculus sandiegensis TaxID=1429043 RepID=A0A0D2J8D5_9BACT|nr:hypothetical protein X474_09920 [Dethiosulfatarculus sandiegensis]
MTAKAKTVLRSSKREELPFTEVSFPRIAIPLTFTAGRASMRAGLMKGYAAPSVFCDFPFRSFSVFPFIIKDKQLVHRKSRCSGRGASGLQQGARFGSMSSQRTWPQKLRSPYLKSYGETSFYCLTHGFNLANLPDNRDCTPWAESGLAGFSWQQAPFSPVRLTTGLAEDRLISTHKNKTAYKTPFAGKTLNPGLASKGCLKRKLSESGNLAHIRKRYDRLPAKES